MAPDIYERLAEHLDNLPAGFPRTESGVEMRILHRLFTPGDAELAVHLTLNPEEPRVIARRAKIRVAEAARRLEEMRKKSLIFSIPQDNKPPLVHGDAIRRGILGGPGEQVRSGACSRRRGVPVHLHGPELLEGIAPTSHDPGGQEHQSPD